MGFWYPRGPEDMVGIGALGEYWNLEAWLVLGLGGIEVGKALRTLDTWNDLPFYLLSMSSFVSGSQGLKGGVSTKVYRPRISLSLSC